MYVQTEAILLFRRTDKNCYINIIEHAPVNTITPTCTFLYYHKISVHATLITTSHFFYLLNINDDLMVTCGKYSRETKSHPHLVSIIKRTDACDFVIQSVEIQLIGSHNNGCSNGNFIIYHTFNFVTEWLHNKKVMQYYSEKSDKLGKDNVLFNESIMENMDNTDKLLDIDSWFDEDVESSMIFLFVSCIIAIFAFILLLFCVLSTNN